MAQQTEMESFINKLNVGKNANLSYRSEAWKAFISISVEVEPREASVLYRPARNCPARQRRRERRENARLEAVASDREAAEKVSAEDTENISENAKECTADKQVGADAEEATADGGKKNSAVLVEPRDVNPSNAVI